MDSFRNTALGLTFWYAFLALLCGLLLIILNDLDARAACLAGADVALLFALGLILKSRRLSEQSIVGGEFWRALPPPERPRSDFGRRMARSALETTWLRFAKGAAMIAIVLCAFALANHHADTSASAQTLSAALSDAG
jgi:hypothetical protein